MKGSVTINGTTYNVSIDDLTPADVLPVFRTDTSILKTDSILLHAAGAQQNSAKKVLLPHLISAVSNAVAEDVVLTIEPYYDDNGTYQGMYWHYNGGWLRRTDTGEMIEAGEESASAALAASQAATAAAAANTAAAKANSTEKTVSENEETRAGAETRREQQAASDHDRAGQDHQTATGDHSRAETDHAAAQTATQGAERVNASLNASGGIVTLTVTDRTGTQTTQEVGFRIAKTYHTVAEMNAALGTAQDVGVGRFVMIDANDNPQDPDMARVYVRTASGFSFIVDLSGAQGIKGDKPVLTADRNGNIYADGVLLTGVIKDAVDAVRAEFRAEEGTQAGSTAGDGTRWGAYKTAEEQRRQAFEDAESDRMAAMVVTRCFVDPVTMCLMFVQPSSDSTEYKVRNGNLNITVSYDV